MMSNANEQHRMERNIISFTLFPSPGFHGSDNLFRTTIHMDVWLPSYVLQNFMAEAAAAPAAQTQAGAPLDQGYNSQAYNSYQAHESVYASPPSNLGHAGGYGSAYGSSYGY